MSGLDAKTKGRLIWSIEQLRLRNIQAREPLARHLEGKLWELREESKTNIYRLVYAFLPGKRVLLLHGFEKKVQKTPRRELRLAERRLEDFIKRGGGE